MTWNDIFAISWFFLAIIGNSAPIVANKIPVLKDWNTPLDFGAHFRGKRLLGSNKTWRGLTFGIFIAIVVVFIQKLILDALDADVVLNSTSFNELPTLLYGFLVGFGALAGDAVESFFKRQVGIAPGHSWFPFDQLDSPIGVVLVTWPLITLTAWQYVFALILGLGFWLLFSYVGWLLKLKDAPI